MRRLRILKEKLIKEYGKSWRIRSERRATYDPAGTEAIAEPASQPASPNYAREDQAWLAGPRTF